MPNPLDLAKRYPCAPLSIPDTVNNFVGILSKAKEIIRFDVQYDKDNGKDIETVIIGAFDWQGNVCFHADVLTYLADEPTWRVYLDKYNVVERNFENSL